MSIAKHTAAQTILLPVVTASVSMPGCRVTQIEWLHACSVHICISGFHYYYHRYLLQYVCHFVLYLIQNLCQGSQNLQGFLNRASTLNRRPVGGATCIEAVKCLASASLHPHALPAKSALQEQFEPKAHSGTSTGPISSMRLTQEPPRDRFHL